MYLSRIELDVKKRNTMIALANPQQFHGAVEMGFKGDRKRNLWRLDKLGNKLYLILLSEDMPELGGIVQQFGTGQAPEIKDYTAYLNTMQNGTLWHFRLTANPTKSLPNYAEGAKRGKVCAHITTEFQEKWLMEKAEKCGFRLFAGSFGVTHTQWQRFRKGDKGNQVSLLSVTYEGILEVTDVQKFKNMLINGIGRGKAYGLGLMTVIRR